MGALSKLKGTIMTHKIPNETGWSAIRETLFLINQGVA